MTVHWRTRALLGVVALAAIASPASAASRRTVTYYLDVFGGCTTQGWSVSRDASGSQECAEIPRATAQGKGVNAVDPDFTLSRRDIPAGAKLDATRKVTGTFYALIPGPNATSPALAGYVAVDYAVIVDHTTIGTVHVEGPTSAVAAAKAAFSLSLPRSLNGKPLISIVVTPTWATCVTPCATGVSGASHSTFVVPLR